MKEALGEVIMNTYEEWNDIPVEVVLPKKVTGEKFGRF